jgi:hypothetical protein
MRIRTIVLAVLLCLGTAVVGSVVAGASPAAAAPVKPLAVDANLGGVDLDTYCKYLGYDGAKLLFPYYSSDWRCFNKSPRPGHPDEEYGISVDGACQYQFANVVAAGYPVRSVPEGSPGTWRCHATPGQTHDYGGMDLSGYCRSIGYGYSKHHGDNVTGWTCVANDGGEFRIDLHAACRYQYPGAVSTGWTLAATWGSYGGWTKIRCLGLHA